MLQFVKPLIQHQTIVFAFQSEFFKRFDILHGGNELGAFNERGYVAWLNYVNAPAGVNWFNYPKVADSTYLVIQNNQMVGIMHLRHELNEFLHQRGGHLGYSVHPNFQGQDIATQMVVFAKNQFKALGLDKILITCQTDNTASRRVILKSGGVHENSISVGEHTIERYWLTLK